MLGIWLGLAFIFGVLAAGEGMVRPVLALALVPAAVMVALLPNNKQRSTVASALLLFGLGAARATHAEPAAPTLASEASAYEVIEAEVVGTPRRFSEFTFARLRLIDRGDDAVESYLPPYPPVSAGDRVRIRARPTDRPLYATWVALSGSSASPWLAWRNRVDSLMHRAIESHVPEPAAALVLGVMVGDDDGMTDATRTAFRGAGMSHITAVSGWNVALVAGFVSALARRRAMTSPWIVLGTLVLIWSYAFVVGLVPTVTRAAIMASLVLLARFRGRPGDAMTGLLLAAAGMLALQPGIRTDIGFQLSFAATLGLILATDHCEGWSGARLAVILPLVAQAAVLPLLMYHFGSFSLMSPVANLIAAPLVPATMFGGLLVWLGASAHPALGGFLGMVAWIPARLIVAIAEACAAITWAHITSRTISAPALVTCYALFTGAYAVWWLRRDTIGGGALGDETDVADQAEAV